jgi:hypothetical protein
MLQRRDRTMPYLRPRLERWALALALAAVACGSRTALLSSSGTSLSPDGGASVGDASTASPDGRTTNPGCPIAAGTTVTLASDPQTVNAIHVNATDVYWSDSNGVYAVPICGGATTTIVYEPSAPGPVGSGLALDATSVYWDTTTAVVRAPLGGGTTTTLATLPSSPGGPIATDGVTVFFVNGGLQAVPVTGGPVTALTPFQAQPMEIAIDATNVYFTGEGPSQASPAYIGRVPKTGGPIATLTTADSLAVRQLVLTGSTLVWLDAGTQLAAVSIAGGAPTFLADQLTDQAIAADANTVFISAATGVIETVPLGGGTLATLATSEVPAPGEIAVAGTSLYWAGPDIVRYGLR